MNQSIITIAVQQADAMRAANPMRDQATALVQAGKCTEDAQALCRIARALEDAAWKAKRAADPQCINLGERPA